MSPTRRDVLKFAAALPVIGATMSRSDALAELAKPVETVSELPDKHPDIIFDPASFASQVDRGSVYEVGSALGINQAAEKRAEYTKARHKMIQLFPELAEENRLSSTHPFIAMDEAMWSIANASYCEGVRAVAAYENLRRAVIQPVQTCPACDGLGLVDQKGKRIWDYDCPNPHDVRPCPDCMGNGTVAAELLKGRLVYQSC